jgi:hypothetical protein
VAFVFPAIESEMQMTTAITAVYLITRRTFSERVGKLW